MVKDLVTNRCSACHEAIHAVKTGFQGVIQALDFIRKSLWRCPWCNGYRRRKWTRRVQMLDETDCISHNTNTLGKGMNPIILPPAMGK